MITAKNIWHSAASMVPDSDRRVLLFDPIFSEQSPIRMGFWNKESKVFEITDFRLVAMRTAVTEVTHWMELPDNPK